MRLTTFWHVLIGLNMGFCVFSWAIQDMSLMALNIVSGMACTVAAWAAKVREETVDNK